MPEADPPEPASSEAAPEPRTVIIESSPHREPPRNSPSGSDPISPSGSVPGYRAFAGWFGSFPIDLSTGQRIFQLISAARRRLIDEQWHLTVCVTDLPLQTARRPVVAHASMTHGVAVLSLPALGAVGVTRRAADALVRLVAALAGDADRATSMRTTTGTRGRAHPGVQRRRGAVTRRLQELGDPVAPDSHGFGLVAGVITGNLRLLLGMLRANRPWRLAIRLSGRWWPRLRRRYSPLSRATSGVLPTGSGRSAWPCSRSAPSPLWYSRSCSARVWERPPRTGSAREQVIMFNLVTLATVVIVLALYGTLRCSTWSAHFCSFPASHSPMRWATRPASPAYGLAWLATSVATVGGALGAGLETDEAIREAAYGYQADAELSR